eukprot:3379321-Pyramimonas_sp.AAC.1
MLLSGHWFVPAPRQDGGHKSALEAPRVAMDPYGVVEPPPPNVSGPVVGPEAHCSSPLFGGWDP